MSKFLLDCDCDSRSELSDQVISSFANEDGQPAGSPLLTEACNARLKQKALLRGHFGKVYAIYTSPVSTHVVSVAQDGRAKFWNYETAALVNSEKEIRLSSGWQMTATLSPTGAVAAFGGLDNVCCLYNVTDQSLVCTLEGHTGYISCARFRNASQIITCSGDSTANLWDIASASRLCSFEGHQADVMSIAVSPSDPALFVSGACDFLCKLWDVRAPAMAVASFQPPPNTKDVNSVSFLSNGWAFCCGGDDGVARVYDLRKSSDPLVMFFLDDSSEVSSVACSATGATVYASYSDGAVRAWSTTTGKCNQVLRGHELRASAIAVSADGTRLISASWDTMLCVWGR